MRALPTLEFEIPLWAKKVNVLGIDEAGRGAFAGPLSVGGVMFDPKTTDKLLTLKINDSKLLSPKKREKLYEEIKNHAIFSHVEFIDLKTINEVGIGKATLIGMTNVWKKSVEILQNVHCLVDAFRIPDVLNQTPIVRGDRLSISIAAASILAKVERDRFMERLGVEFPNYGFEIHKGYGTLSHRTALKEFGASRVHRTQFVRRFV